MSAERSVEGLASDLRVAVLAYAARNAHMRSPFEDSLNSLEVNLLVDQLAAFHPEECKEITARITRWVDNPAPNESVDSTSEPGQIVTNPTGDIGRRMIEVWDTRTQQGGRMSQSLFERLECAVTELGEVAEAFAEEVYVACERETLKHVAIDAGVDHTCESTVVIAEIGHALQRERDVVRELRRALAARDRLIERLQTSAPAEGGERHDLETGCTLATGKESGASVDGASCSVPPRTGAE